MLTCLLTELEVTNADHEVYSVYVYHWHTQVVTKNILLHVFGCSCTNYMPELSSTCPYAAHNHAPTWHWHCRLPSQILSPQNLSVETSLFPPWIKLKIVPGKCSIRSFLVPTMKNSLIQIGGPEKGHWAHSCHAASALQHRWCPTSQQPLTKLEQEFALSLPRFERQLARCGTMWATCFWNLRVICQSVLRTLRTWVTFLWLGLTVGGYRILLLNAGLLCLDRWKQCITLLTLLHPEVHDFVLTKNTYTSKTFDHS